MESNVSEKNLWFWRIAIAASILIGWFGSPQIGYVTAYVLQSFLPETVALTLTLGVGMTAVIWLPLLTIGLYCFLGYRPRKSNVERTESKFAGTPKTPDNT